jgi:hypothetical protein
MPRTMPQAISPTISLDACGGGERDGIAATLTGCFETQLKVAPWTASLDALGDHLDLTWLGRAAVVANAALADGWRIASSR